MLRKLLAGFAIASMIVCLLALIFWWRSFHHIDHISYPGIGGNRGELTTSHGILMVTRTNTTGQMVNQSSNFYPMRQVVAGCLVIPALWLALAIRAMLPRPGRVRHGLIAPVEERGGRNGSGSKV